MLDPDDDFTIDDYETADVNSIAKQLSEAVATEVKQNQVTNGNLKRIAPYSILTYWGQLYESWTALSTG